MTPTPDPSLVADLHAYDPKLRIRWAKNIGKWFIERQLEKRNPQLMLEAPIPDSASSIRKDLWESWVEGYIHVLTVPVELAHWRFIAPELARMDSWRQGGWKALNDQMDADEDQWHAEKDKAIDSWAQAASRDAHDHIAWFEKRRVSVPDAIDTGLGFKVRDLREPTRG